MYNRYIMQPDGSYRRNREQEPARRPAPENKTDDPLQGREPADEAEHEHGQEPAKPTRPPVSRTNMGAGSFLKQLLPKDFDTGDLLIVLLLLLMAGDSAEDKNTALLTLALYCFM